MAGAVDDSTINIVVVIIINIIILIAVASKSEVVMTEDAPKPEFEVPASVGENTEQPVTDNPDIDLTLSACEYVPGGELF